MVTHGFAASLGFWWPGDASWTAVDRWELYIYDITYYKDKLYAVDVHGRVIVCDVNGPNNPTQVLAAVSLLMENWSELLRDLLVEIAKQITSIEDFVSFGAVCSSWYAAATRDNFTPSTQIPWLMLADVEQQNESERWRQFFSLSSGRIFKVILPEASKIRCLSSLGWLLTLGELKANLLHPLSRLQIELPDLNTFQDYDEHENFLLDYVHRMVLSASPAATRDYMVMVTHGFAASLGFWRPGDASWTAVDQWELYIYDINYYKDKLYAVDVHGSVIVCDVNGPNPTQINLVSSPPDGFLPLRNVQLYLLGWLNNTLLVVSRKGVQLTDAGNYGTTTFRVFQLDLRDKKWSEINNLGNRALFLGFNSSFSMETSGMNRCKANCIYFTDDCVDSYRSFPGGGGRDMGVFNISDGSIKPHFDGRSLSLVTPPTWVQPSF
ncbi:hypothetical protein RJ639_033104 [Escallonia herrerae]|uniref:KIB1-4 beta-propeller domain-containing protein n=1 Tax=Escallonia herrerae TaxID=1293975 RepID=A0AA89B7Z0_9ASTE|nr:hypothetical protein RJ639_033104 [Escallonia herrerae]